MSNFTELGLTSGNRFVLTGGGAPLEAWKRLANDALDMICDAFNAADDGDWDDERAEIERCRARLTESVAAGMQASAEACLSACHTAFQRIEGRQQSKRGEITGLIAQVREAVAALHEDGLDESTERMSALAEISDPRQLKERLVTEVAHLKQLVIERREGWAVANATFERRVATLETELVHSQREASRDPLTGIANRRTLESRIKAALEAPQPHFVVALLDIDGFKEINDTYGHPVGDAVLVALVGAIRSVIRPEDTFARIGGDEFALLLPGMTSAAAVSRLRALFVRLRDAAMAGHHVTLSCGLSEVAAGDTVASVIARADKGLYAAKDQGKNRVCVKSAPFISTLLDAGRKRLG